jgi:cellulose synthase/poly-beta-1,6-N-acetylglucosamine synthase-like glycosyltransferase
MILAAYAFHILLFTYGWMKLGRNIKRTIFRPDTTVSILVALRDEKDNIHELVMSLKELSFPQDGLEIIFIDDHSSDGSKEYIEQLVNNWELDHAKVISLKDLGIAGSKKMAIETAVSLARGELILVTDADCRAGKDWLLTIVEAYETTGAKMITGPVKPEVGKGFSGKFRELEFLSLTGTGAGSTGAGVPIFCNGANMAFTKEAFQAVGGYSGNKRFSSGDDVFLLHKIRKEFGRDAVHFILDRKAIVNTIGRDSWSSFLNQRIRWASKTKAYRSVLSITTAASVFLMNLALIFTAILGVIDYLFFFLFGYLFMMKVMTDTPIMMGITAFFKRQSLMRWFLLFEMAYIFYVVITGPISIFYGGKWKGRKVSH